MRHIKWLSISERYTRFYTMGRHEKKKYNKIYTHESCLKKKQTHTDTYYTYL